MSQNIILTTTEYQNEVSTLAQSCGSLVLTLYSASISYSVESQNIWAYKATEWNTSHESLTAYSYSDAENDLLKTGAVLYNNLLQVGVYAAVLPYDYHHMSEVEVLSCTANILRAHGNSVIVISSTYSNGNTTALNYQKGETSAIVESIEKDLGIDLEVSSDSEFNSILHKNGAGPLAELLRMAYGPEKKKT